MTFTTKYEDITLLNIKTYYKASVIKQCDII